MELTAKHAELVGLHFGDGSLIQRKNTDRLRFQLRGDATSDREHYESFIIPLCNELIGFPILGKLVCTILDKKLNSFGVSIESNKLKNFFEELCVPVGVKEELPIPKWIMDNSEFSKAFVRGLFDTDGNIYYKKNNTAKSNLNTVGLVSIVSTSNALILDSSKILNNLEIKHYIKKYVKKEEKNAYKIEIYRPHHKRFMEFIGSNNPKHLDKFEIGERFGFCPPRTTPIQRKQILKGELNPFYLKAGVP